MPIVVRIRGGFGQEDREIAYCCPNKWFIQNRSILTEEFAL
ncbi:hypothetical protein [Bacillus coreaensis]